MDDIFGNLSKSVLSSFTGYLGQPVLFLSQDLQLIAFNPAAKLVFPLLRQGILLPIVLRNPDFISKISDFIIDAQEPECQHNFTQTIQGQKHEYKVYCHRLENDSANKDLNKVFSLSFYDVSQANTVDGLHSDFVANVSHELRTPLASIVGFIETLQSSAKNDHEVHERFLKIMAAQAQRMTHLIESLLVLSRAEANRNRYPTDKVVLQEVIADLCQAMRPLAQERHITIIDNLSCQKQDGQIYGDVGEVFQIFQNIVDNALKYSPSKTEITISWSTEYSDDEHIAISVTDQGRGIAQKDIPRLTQRFYRVDDARHRSDGGAGLGLAIVQQILKRHKARVHIASIVGQGSCFTVIFPIIT